MTPAHHLLVLAVTLLVVFAPAPSASAQTYDDETIAAVNDHFARGERYFYEEDYPNAIREFEAANALIPNAIFLYNISVAYERMGKQEEALQKAEEADNLGGLGPNEQVANQARIAALQRSQQAQAVSSDSKFQAPFHFTKWGWIGTAATAVGGLMLVNVAIIDGRLSDEVADYERAAANNNVSEYNRLKDEIDSRQTGARVLFVLGSAAFVGGIGLIVWDLKFNDANPGADSDVSVGLFPTRGGAAATLRLNF